MRTVRGIAVVAAATAVLLLAANINTTTIVTAGRTQSQSPDTLGVRLDALDSAVVQLSRQLELPPPALAMGELLPPPPPPAIEVARVVATVPITSHDTAGFLLAQPAPITSDREARRLLKSMLGLAKLIGRTLIVPASLCADGALAPAGASLPWGCSLRPVARSVLEHWRQNTSSPAGHLLPPAGSSMLPAVVAATNFHGARAATLSTELRRSHVRISLPDGMSDLEASFALRDYATTRILEVERAAEAFCGWDPKHDRKRLGVTFDADTDAVLGAPTALAPCSHYHAGAGVVLSFTNIGTQGDVTAVSAPFSALPASVRRLPNGTDLLVTFATGSVSTMALNWASNIQRAGIAELLIGALDEGMMAACALAGVPCVLINGGETSKVLAAAPGQNLRSRPSLYPKMSVLKVCSYDEPHPSSAPPC